MSSVASVPPAAGLTVYLRSIVFAAALLLITPPYSFVCLASAPFPAQTRWWVISGWARMVMWLSRTVLKLDFVVQGLEHLPREPSIILSKHQSAWETIAFQCIFPPHVHVLKRSLLWIPFFGWGLALMSPIAIDRSKGTQALKAMVQKGKQRLAEGFSILIFPEGTRTSPGARATYHNGGAWLAVRTGAQVVPVAHNAGVYWRKNAFIKRPGRITVVIGAPISPAGLKAEALNGKVEAWIESRMERLCSDA